MEIQVTCFHESRHSFQWKCINGVYIGELKVNEQKLQSWKKEMDNYNQPTQSDVTEENYLKQEVEIQMIAFAHKMMLVHFELKTTIPKLIRAKSKKCH